MLKSYSVLRLRDVVLMTKPSPIGWRHLGYLFRGVMLFTALITIFVAVSVMFYGYANGVVK